MKIITFRNIRRFSQGIFLLVFLSLFVQTESKGDDTLGYPVRLFLDFDPLLALTSWLAAHAIPLVMLLSVLVAASTLFAGRFFCGWICPLGTLNHLAGNVRYRPRVKINPGLRRVKYYLLVFLVAGAVFGFQWTGLLDPLSFLIRSLSLAVYPLFNFITRSIFDLFYNLNIPGVTNISEAVYSFFKSSVLAFRQPHFEQALFIGLLFFGVLGLNLLQKRFWCHNICPLGALLGILARFSPFVRTVAEGCNECGACLRECQGGAEPHRKEGWRKPECLYCGNCAAECPGKEVRFGFKRAAAPLDLQRRGLVASVLGALAILPLVRVAPVAGGGSSDPALIRPPGSLPEKEFLRRCVKCGECMKVCTTNGLQPAFLQAGLEGIWTPMLVSRIGYCEYRCTLCGHVCPTGAIKRMEEKEKTEVKIGLAVIDKNKCLPYAESESCIVCEEVCPIPRKAVWFEEVTVRTREGAGKIVKQPRVDSDRCTGCGICENKCPVEGSPAIYITALKKKA